MEPVTHVLTGACLARTGFNRRIAYATAAMAIGAEFPDIDTVWSLRGPVAGFEHHRGITHTLLGIPLEAALLLLGFFLYHGWRHRPSGSPETHPRRRRTAPVRWAALYGLLLLALGSHILLDFTNNYGVRPFFPFQSAWYAASIVFIFDPLIFSLLCAGLLLPALFGLISREVGARRDPYRGRGWARAALLCIVFLWAVRWVEHQHAIALAQGQTLRAPAAQNSFESANAASKGATPGAEPQLAGQADLPAPDPQRPLLTAQRTWASPDPFSVFRWYTATDFGPAYRLGVADNRLDTLLNGPILEKAQPTASLLTAERTRLGRVYLDWSALPLVRVQNGLPEEIKGALTPSAKDQTVVFTDLRFSGDLPLLQRNGRPPLAGEVVLDPTGRVLAEGMDGRFGR